MHEDSDCRPGYQIETRNCKDGVNMQCSISDVLKIAPCYQHDCPRIVGPWINNGSCECTGSSSGNQVQIRTCHDGTTEKCSEIEAKRTLSCSETGSSLLHCSKSVK